jgi:hypothetical protein
MEGWWIEKDGKIGKDGKYGRILNFFINRRIDDSIVDLKGKIF